MRDVQSFGVSGPHWKKSCLGPHIKYTATRSHTQKNPPHNVLSKFTVLCWATFIVILDHMWPVGCVLDTPGFNLKSLFNFSILAPDNSLLRVPQKIHCARAAVTQWTECQPANQTVTGSIPSQGTCLGCRPSPQWEAHKRQLHVDVYLFLCSLLSRLSKNK